MRIGFTDVDGARQLLENYCEQTGDTSTPDVTPESLVEAVVGGHIRVAVNEGPFLTHMIKQVEFPAQWISAFELEIVRAQVKTTGFVICDYPFVVVPPGEHPEAIGLGFPGTVKYFPLTRALCLRMGELDDGFSYGNAGKEEVRVINQNIAVNSERFVMGPSRGSLSMSWPEVERLRSILPRGQPLTSFSVIATVGLSVSVLAAAADCPLSALFAAHRFFMASESALRAAALKCGFGLAVLAVFGAFAPGAALDSPLIFAHRSF